MIPYQPPFFGYPVTRYADPVKKNLDLISDFKTEHGVVGFSVGERQEAHGDCLVFIQDFLAKHFGGKHLFIVPKNAVTVSFAMENFTVGKSCQEFAPDPKIVPEAPSDSFLSYQKFSKHVQATYYNQDGVQYLAGLCYYPQMFTTMRRTCQLDGNALDNALDRGELFPLTDRTKTKTYLQKKRYGRHCNRAKGRVTVEVTEKGPQHAFFIYGAKKMMYLDCEECKKEHGEYKFVTAPAKVAPTPPFAQAPKKKKEEKVKKVSYEEEEFDFGDDN